MKFTKDMIGKTIFALPTGNNAARGLALRDQKLQEFEVVAIGRVYATLKYKGWNMTRKFHMEGGAQESEVRSGHSLNSGYVFFENMDEYEAYFVFRGKLDAIGEFCRGWGWGGKQITPSQADALHQCLVDNEIIKSTTGL